jgi:hypothetical protein
MRGHAVRMGDRRGIPYRKRPLGKPRHRWKIIFKWIFKKWDGEAWTRLIRLGIGKGGWL